MFTAASDEGTPLRINPFEVEDGTTVAEHIDLLRAVFAASFGDMWSPLPQVLEQCMLRAYQDRGWDLLSDQNHRLADGEDRALAFPTLRELAGTVDDIVGRLGFDPEARDRVRGSLATRISGLRAGSKGALFDTRTPLSMASLLGGPAILELERLADESDKAFLMGLLLIRLAEFRRGQQRAAGVGPCARGRPSARAGHRGGPPAAGERGSRQRRRQHRQGPGGRVLLQPARRDPRLRAGDRGGRPGTDQARPGRGQEHEPEDRPPDRRGGRPQGPRRRPCP